MIPQIVNQCAHTFWRTGRENCVFVLQKGCWLCGEQRQVVREACSSKSQTAHEVWCHPQEPLACRAFWHKVDRWV